MSKIISGLNRRQFLRHMGVGVSASMLASKSIADTLVNKDNAENSLQGSPFTKDDLPSLNVDNNLPTQTVLSATRCKTPSIETRLFASSNVGTNDTRNTIGLERLACAGFKIANPDIVSRQYLRFAGTDSQRASDLQNIATGAIAAPKL